MSTYETDTYKLEPAYSAFKLNAEITFKYVAIESFQIPTTLRLLSKLEMTDIRASNVTNQVCHSGDYSLIGSGKLAWGRNVPTFQ